MMLIACAVQVALYCSESDDYTLMEYLATARDPLGKPLYAPQAALRLARQHKRLRACVELLWELTLFEVQCPIPLVLFKAANSYTVIETPSH